MQLLAAWKDSLTIFKPDNFKLFTLITLNSLVKSYQVWLRYWGWLAILYFLFHAISFRIGFILIPFLIYVSFFLSVRPSVKIKNYTYFAEYAVRSCYVILFLAIWLVALGNLISVKLQSTPTGTIYSMEPSSGFICAALFDLIVSGFYTLFIFDSRGAWQDAFASIWRALKMFLFNLPFCLI